ncbi:transposase domain-containing protein [Roseovarius sp. D22-M7]
MFAGDDEGGKPWCRIASLIETAKINGVETVAYLKATLQAIAGGHPEKRFDDLLPREFTTSSPPHVRGGRRSLAVLWRRCCTCSRPIMPNLGRCTRRMPVSQGWTKTRWPAARSAEPTHATHFMPQTRDARHPADPGYRMATVRAQKALPRSDTVATAQGVLFELFN